jgi:hypothetical protein
MVQKDGFVPKFYISQKQPRWHQLSDITRNIDTKWDADGYNGTIVRAYWDGAGVLSFDYLIDPGESDTAGGSFTWSTPIALFTDPGGIYTYLPPPSVAHDQDGWHICILDSSNNFRVYNAPTGSPASMAEVVAKRQDVTGILSGGEYIPFIAYGGGNETVYVVVSKADNNQNIWFYSWNRTDSVWGQYDSGVYYPQAFYSFDVQWFAETNADVNMFPDYGNGANANIRHLITVCTQRPPFYQYSVDSTGAPQKNGVATGGIISWVITPPFRGVIGVTSNPDDPGSTEPPPDATTISITNKWPNHEEIDVLNPFTQYQSRIFGRISTGNTFYNNANEYVDEMIVTTYGSEGDWNAYQSTVYYQVLISYRSRDGVHWTQGERITAPFGQPINVASKGFVMIHTGQHLYLINKTSTTVSRASFPYSPSHPATKTEISLYINSYQSDFSQLRQTSMSIEDPDGLILKSIQTEPNINGLAGQVGLNAYDLLCYLGNGKNIKQLISWETVDVIQPTQQSFGTDRKNQLQITSRGLLADVLDRKANVDSVLHDSPVIRTDNYAPLNGAANSGLGHTATQSGTLGTSPWDGLKVLGNNELTVGFSTFKDSVENFSANIVIKAPYLIGHWAGTPYASSFISTGPVTILNGYRAGIVFRAIDKDNFWLYYYDFYAAQLKLGQMVAGVFTDYAVIYSVSLASLEVAPNYLFRLGVDAYYSMFTLKYWSPAYIESPVAPTWSSPYVAHGVPHSGASNDVFMSGYVGPGGKYYSDEDTTALSGSGGTGSIGGGSGVITPPPVYVPPPPPPGYGHTYIWDWADSTTPNPAYSSPSGTPWGWVGSISNLPDGATNNSAGIGPSAGTGGLYGWKTYKEFNGSDWDQILGIGINCTGWNVGTVTVHFNVWTPNTDGGPASAFYIGTNNTFVSNAPVTSLTASRVFNSVINNIFLVAWMGGPGFLMTGYAEISRITVTYSGALPSGVSGGLNIP